MSNLDLIKIKNLKAWIVLPELYEIEIGEWGWWAGHTDTHVNLGIYKTYSHANLFRDYVDKLNVFSQQYKLNEYLTYFAYITEPSFGYAETMYIEKIIDFHTIESMIYSNIGNFNEKEADPGMYELKRAWMWSPPEGNLEKLLLEIEKEASNEQA